MADCTLLGVPVKATAAHYHKLPHMGILSLLSQHGWDRVRCLKRDCSKKRITPNSLSPLAGLIPRLATSLPIAGGPHLSCLISTSILQGVSPKQTCPISYLFTTLLDFSLSKSLTKSWFDMSRQQHLYPRVMSPLTLVSPPLAPCPPFGNLNCVFAPLIIWWNHATTYWRQPRFHKQTSVYWHITWVA